MKYRPGEDKLTDSMMTLKRHLRTCKECIKALKVNDIYLMCHTGAWLVIRSAIHYDSLVKLRIQASQLPGGCVYACPELSKHGAAYELTALPLVVTGIQGQLF